MMAGVTLNYENAGPGKASPEEEEEQEEVRVSFSEEETTIMGADLLVDSSKNNINKKKMGSYVGRRLTAIEAKVLRKKLLEMAVEEEINALRQQEDREAGFLHDLQHNTLYLGFLFRTFVRSFPLFVPRHPPLFNLHEEGEGEANEKEKEKRIEESEASEKGGYVFWAQMERLVQMVKRLRLSTAAERGQAQSDLDRFWNVVKRRAVQVLQHIVLVVPSPPPSSLLMQNNRFDEEEMKEEEEEVMTAMEKEETEIERETRVYMESLHKFKTSIASTEGLNLFLRMVREKEKLQDMPPDLVNLIRSCYKLMAHNLFLLLHAPSTNDSNNTNDENSSTEDCAANRLASLRSILTWTPFFTLRMMAKVTNPLRLTRSVFGLFLAKPFGCQNLAQRIVEKALETELEEENIENEEEGSGGLVEEGEEEQKEEKKEGAEGYNAVDSANKKKLQKKVGNKKAIKQVETYVRDVFPTTVPSFSPAVNRRQSRNKQQLQRLEKILDPSTRKQLTDEQLEAAYLLLIREIKERDGHQLVQLLGDDEVIAILEHLFSIVYRSLFNIYKHTDLPNFIKAIATTLTAIVNTADQYQKQQQELLEKKKKRMKKSTHQKRSAWLNISWLKKNNDDKDKEDESVCNKENGNVEEAKEAEDDEEEKAEEEHIKRVAIEGYVVAVEGFVEEAYGMLHSILVAEQVQAKQAGNGETEDGTFLHMLHWFFVRLQTVVNTLQLRDSPQRQKENDAKRNEEDENLYDGGGVIDLQQLLTHQPTTSQEEDDMWREIQELVRHYHCYQRYRQQKLQWKLSHHKQQRNNQKSEQNQEKSAQMPLPPPSPDVPNLQRLLPSFNQETHLLFARVEKCLQQHK